MTGPIEIVPKNLDGLDGRQFVELLGGLLYPEAWAVGLSLVDCND